MINIDFDYYKNEYCGNQIQDESDFKRLSRQASAYLSTRTFGRFDELNEDYEFITKVKDCICSVVDVINANVSNEGVEHGQISSESIGPWSISYNTNSSSSNNSSLSYLDQSVYNKVELYLSNTGLLYGGDFIR